MADPTRPTVRHAGWYVTAHSVREQVVDGESRAWPSSLAHAKQVGTNLTACGELATSWRTLWLVPFPASRTATCSRCAGLLRDLGIVITVPSPHRALTTDC